jgi:hypothetical protein
MNMLVSSRSRAGRGRRDGERHQRVERVMAATRHPGRGRERVIGHAAGVEPGRLRRGRHLGHSGAVVNSAG